MLQHVRVYRGAYIISDHCMLVGSLMLKLRSCYMKRSCRKRYDLGRLKDPLIMKECVGKLRSCLDPSTCTGLDGDVKSHWTSLKDGFTRAAEPVSANQERGRKE